MSSVDTYAWADLRLPANLITLGRIVLSPLLFVLILASSDSGGTSWAALVVGWVLGASDYYDGWMARTSGSVSRWGAFLDPLADKVMILGACWCFVFTQRLSWIPVLIITVRELLVSIARTRWARQGLSLPARRSAKLKTLMQGVALTVAVLPPLETVDWAVLLAIWLAVAITVYSGWRYFADGRLGAVAS
ncbi:MAG: CDP-alcohol phosphatidyltransferase family protein [Acidimicrobiia bacterium]|nr:CDP-alcohol phosphatidyltransferase family protein [Acidimicrobiia bacterium]MYC58169.1 CDP-alcohol phosphatidyltransferase family protein [Acidimicrobiia bacterium]MYG94344.1 CDP-alcohol phosphatidyltransferase family protein [Acidimicrobiia bacterium]MYI30601.1 CDP-alcohol phosphatidyltransferase family protein [Acidimicrobiia bacterium]